MFDVVGPSLALSVDFDLRLSPLRCRRPGRAAAEPRGALVRADFAPRTEVVCPPLLTRLREGLISQESASEWERKQHWWTANDPGLPGAASLYHHRHRGGTAALQSHFATGPYLRGRGGTKLKIIRGLGLESWVIFDFEPTSASTGL